LPTEMCFKNIYIKKGNEDNANMVFWCDVTPLAAQQLSLLH